jgi:hypothetical protein
VKISQKALSNPAGSFYLFEPLRFLPLFIGGPGMKLLCKRLLAFTVFGKVALDFPAVFPVCKFNSIGSGKEMP